MTGMALRAAVAVVRDVRRDTDVVITTMGTAREWLALGPLHPLDFVLVPSAMGHATSLGLGLALARPGQRIIVLNGDGSMLMNLGSLVSITAAGVPNLAIVICDNGVYEVTGAQPTPGAPAGRSGRDAIDWLPLARAAGFRSVTAFAGEADWRREAGAALAATGPAFIHVEVAADPTAGGPRSPGPAPDRARRFREALLANPLPVP